MDTTNLQLICINTSTLCSRISRGNTNARMTMTRIASLARAGGSRVDAHLHVSSPRPVGKSQEFLSFRVGLLTTLNRDYPIGSLSRFTPVNLCRQGGCFRGESTDGPL